MPQPVTTPEASRSTDTSPATVGTEELVEADDLVEEVSIDGMCGVY